MHLLLCEDETAIRTAVARALGADGWQVEQADCLAAARALAADQRPDALLSDFKLPDGTGLELAREIGVPFCLMSGYLTVEDCIAAMRAGCRDLFIKPAPLAEIRNRFRQMRSAAGGPWAVDAASGLAADGSPEGLGWTTVSAGWTDADAARAAQDGLDAQVATPAARLIISELLQAAPAGRLTVMQLGRKRRYWLAAEVDWAAQADRRIAVDRLAPGGSWTGQGALIETMEAAS